MGDDRARHYRNVLMEMLTAQAGLPDDLCQTMGFLVHGARVQSILPRPAEPRRNRHSGQIGPLRTADVG
ncbi:hypothetical protein GOZ83_12960 [Agrobacterium vitis]|uniref:hypothetical protein n=1 Tax=Rhizobium/Agrobacterium group TaxID=227290 RepID=UPI0012E89162|nr:MULTISPECIES: hypothetical protein [Rhizobium/Agrobacterium group]MCF1494468.1 hypothetical protein [Allorhizobium ampelinum]MVA45974.1 hypothetical protein [Agrobacterium vitis]